MAILGRYTPKDLKGCNKRKLFLECHFEDILNMTVAVRVARYARESTNHEDQIKALENQVERLDAFIADHENFVIKEKYKYTERGVSGRRMDDRDAFQLMLEAARRREFDIIIVQDVCRFARNMRELLNIIEELKQYDIGILILDGKYWTFNMDETDILRLALEAGMAQGESMRTAKRVHNGVESYRARGQLVVSGLFGYVYVKKVDRRNNTFCIDPVDGLTVKTIFDLYTHPDSTKRMGSQRIAAYLNDHGMKAANGKLTWTASKVNRVLRNEKYMGYILYGKFLVEDTITKKKIATKVKPVKEDSYDDQGNMIESCNLIKGDWEPIVSEEQWWLAYQIRSEKAATYIYSVRGNIVNGLRESVDVIANKSFCQCGYSLSPQYVHVAKDGKAAQMRYKCRCQINMGSKAYKVSHQVLANQNQCDLPAVSEVKMWLMSKKVFERVFGDNREAILETIRIVKEARTLAKESPQASIDRLQGELEEAKVQQDNLYLDKLAGKTNEDTYTRLAFRLQETVKTLEEKIAVYRKEVAGADKEVFDLTGIEKKLYTYVDFSGVKVSNEMIDLFVERIIRRENDEFLWVMNLSGERSDTRKYRIAEYSEEYAKKLQSDEGFDIVDQFMISLEECREFVTSKEVNRRFVPKFWQPIIVKIAVR